MHLYNCKVRLSGSLYNEIPKTGITAAEIAVLKVLHGDDAVVDISVVGEDKKKSSVALRGELTLQYGKALRSVEGVGSINGIFGVAGELPVSLPGFTLEKKKAGKTETKAATTELPAGAELATDEDVKAEAFE